MATTKCSFLCFAITSQLLFIHDVISAVPKHVILIIADDMGWRDVGFHGSEIPTPNLDALASTGTILNNFYVAPICTPSRAEMMTGRYALRTGIFGPIPIFCPYGLGLDEKLLPEYLKQGGYDTHLVGKWHLGLHKEEHLPTNRGFDTHYGCRSSFTDYWDHRQKGGLDFMDNDTPVTNQTNVYRTDLYTQRAVKIIKNHPKNAQPLFLEIAHQAPHFGMEFAPNQAPKKYVDAVPHITAKNRQLYAAMMVSLDHSIGQVVLALQESGMLNDSLIIFTSDNGGAAAGQYLSQASNWPLRGAKGSAWEGGVRAPAFIWHPGSLPNPGTVSDVLMHGTDLVPTILAAVNAPGDLYRRTSHPIDGVNQWEVLTSNAPKQRDSVMHIVNDHLYGYRKGDWKLVFGKTILSAWDQWYESDFVNEAGVQTMLEKHGLYRIRSETKRDAILAGFKNGAGSGETRASTDIQDIHGTANSVKAALKTVVGNFSNVIINVTCDSPNTATVCDYGTTPCLFNITEDPCEYNNVAGINSAVVADLLREIGLLRNESAPNRFRPAVKYRWQSPEKWLPWVTNATTKASPVDKCSGATSMSHSTSVLMASILSMGFMLALSMA